MTPDSRLSKSDIARGYDALPEHKFMPSKYHRFCLSLAGVLEGRVLDLGCGPGRMTDVLGSSGSRIRLFASDLSFQQCRTTAQKSCRPHVCQSDAEHLPFRDNAFDAIFMIEVLDHLYEPVKAIREVRRVLKPGGRLIVSVPNRDWMRYDAYMRGRKPFQPVDDHWFRADEIRTLLFETGFEIRTARGGENLYFGGGILRAFEKIAIALCSSLETRMKRLILISTNAKDPR